MPALAAVALSAAFSTLDSAALAALEHARPLSGRVEHAGAVYQCGDVYTYTDPLPGKEGSFRFRLTIPAGCRLAGLYHTHPGRYGADALSEHDKATARRLGVPSYIVVTATGRTAVYVPSTTR